MKRYQKSGAGFTLIELLLYVSIVGAMVLAVSAMLPLFMTGRVKNQTIAEVDQQAAQVMQMMTQTIRNATAVNSPTQGQTAAALSVNVTDSAKSPTIFDLSGAVLRITEGAGSPVSLTNSRLVVSNLSFQNLGRTGTKGAVRIQFTLTHLNPEGRQEYNFSKTYYASASLR